MNGQILHMFLREGIADLPKEHILGSIRRNIIAREKLKNTKVIVIDEHPQVAERWFNVLEYVVRQLAVPHPHALPWGGCHVLSRFSVLFFFVYSGLHLVDVVCSLEF